ncbi:MAG: GNAT family N-acetyltransferase [Chloroflexi bacterium]|mgnify:FL=1|nr:GNAT family N-acetyltransferase [Chloroflexota bacterium]
MTPYECQNGNITISTDPARLDLDFVHGFLANESYWAKGIERDRVERFVEHSLNFGLYKAGQQVGYLRIITDYTTYAHISDVFMHAAHRGQGLAQMLMRCALAHPELQGLRKWTLYTHDAQSLYYRFGFRVPPTPGNHMVYRVPNER